MIIKISSKLKNVRNYIIYEPSELEYSEQKIKVKKANIKSYSIIKEERLNIEYDQEVELEADELTKSITTITLGGESVVELAIEIRPIETKDNLIKEYELVATGECFLKNENNLRLKTNKKR